VASEEEVDITIKTIGDVSGARQVANSLTETQQVAQQAQQSTQQAGAAMSASANAMNAFMQQAMRGLAPTMENFRAQFEAIRKTMGQAPTLGPEAFGITKDVQAQAEEAAKAYQPSTAFATLMNARQSAESLDDPQQQARLYQTRIAQERQFQQLLRERARAVGPGGAIPGALDAPPAAVARLREAADATKDIGEKAAVSNLSIVRFAGALVGVGIGFSIYRAAGAELHDVFQALIDDSLKAQQALRDNSITFGQNAAAFQSWAATVSEQANVAQTALLQAGTAAQQFGRQVGFSPDQTKGLEAAAVLLSRIHGIDVAQTMNLLTQAIQGNAQAAQTLNLQLDAGYIAFNQLGGATAEVFNQLDPATQAMLRTQTALQQLGSQAATSAPQLDSLREAQGKLSQEWDRFVSTTGPGVIGALGGILDKVNSVIDAFGKFNALTVARSAGGQDPGFKNEIAALDALQAKINEIFPDIGKPIQDLPAEAQAAQQAIKPVVDAIQDANNALKDQTGIDALQTAAKVLGTVGSAALMNLPGVLQQVAGAAQTAGGAIGGVADQADRAANSALAIAAHNEQVLNVATQLVPAQQALAQAQSNDITAARLLVDYKSQQLSLTADEARIKLQALPTQERLVELQNQASLAQLRAQQAALPSSRAQQDLQNQIRLNTLIAQSPDRSMDERQAALARATALTRRNPETDIAALQTQMATLPASRAVEDISNEQRAQTLILQSALQPFEYQKQQIDLLSQIATAAKDAAQRTVELTVQAINVIVNGANLGALTDTDRTNIVNLAGQAVLDAIDGAIKSVDKRGASSQLIAGQPA